ncbi:MAG TPA: tripartite tricarboxylate transporter substrate binding protein [Burkholderiales bacterium]|nr:tripartite tricarboxylate transporter substrate binding protein [Burkholderiales bacterium]
MLPTITLAQAASMGSGQDFPTRPIRLLVPSTPGGSVDTLARAIGTRLAEKFSQQVVVDNRAGAGGVIAGELTAKAPPDGYTLMLGTVAALASNVSLKKSIPYDPLRDFAPVTLAATQNLILIVTPALPVKNVKDLIALAKSKPGQLTFASAGSGAGGHLSGELFKLLAGIDILHIPYKGMAPAMVDVISGQVSLSFPSIITALPQVKSGKVRALAVTGAKRSQAAPDVITMQEAGVTGYESATWYGVVAPVATPRAIITRLNNEIVAILKQPELRDRLAAEGAEPLGSTPEEFGRHLKSEIAKWARVAKAAGLRAD